MYYVTHIDVSMYYQRTATFLICMMGSIIQKAESPYEVGMDKHPQISDYSVHRTCISQGDEPC